PRIAEAAALLSTRMVTSAYPTALEMLLDSAQTRLAALRANRPAAP
ncbi:TetR/AcrR family transcriptional regulator, partial [Streptomyces sp. NPDC002491]